MVTDCVHSACTELRGMKVWSEFTPDSEFALHRILAKAFDIAAGME
jgi:hypothetical protein